MGPIRPAIQPIASYPNPIVSAITAVASGCSRFCGFTDLGQAISLVRQGEYTQAGGKALEGALRLGVLVAVACCIKEISDQDDKIGDLSLKLQKEQKLRKTDVESLKKELKLVEDELKFQKRARMEFDEKIRSCKNEKSANERLLKECRLDRGEFEDLNIELKKEIETMKGNAGWAVKIANLNPFASSVALAKQSDLCSKEKMEQLQTDLGNARSENLQLRDTLESEKNIKRDNSVDRSGISVPALTPEELKRVHDKWRPVNLLALKSSDASLARNSFLCEDVVGVTLDCDTRAGIKMAFNAAALRCHPQKFSGKDQDMASSIQNWIRQVKPIMVDEEANSRETKT